MHSADLRRAHRLAARPENRDRDRGTSECETKHKAFIPGATFRALYSEQYVENFIFQASSAEQVPTVTRSVYEILGRRHKFDPEDKEAIAMWDTSEAEKLSKI